MNGKKLKFDTMYGMGIKINEGPCVAKGDIEATNGMIHVLTNVLIPK